jgi:hypothetical protein
MARLMHNTLSAFDAFDDRPALFDHGVEFMSISDAARKALS